MRVQLRVADEAIAVLDSSASEEWARAPRGSKTVVGNALGKTEKALPGEAVRASEPRGGQNCSGASPNLAGSRAPPFRARNWPLALSLSCPRGRAGSGLGSEPLKGSELAALGGIGTGPLIPGAGRVLGTEPLKDI